MDLIERIRWKNKEFRRYVHHGISLCGLAYKLYSGISMNTILLIVIASDLCTGILNYSMIVKYLEPENKRKKLLLQYGYVIFFFIGRFVK